MIRALAEYYNEDPEAFTLPVGTPEERGRAFVEQLIFHARDLPKEIGRTGQLLANILAAEVSSIDLVALGNLFVR